MYPKAPRLLSNAAVLLFVLFLIAPRLLAQVGPPQPSGGPANNAGGHVPLEPEDQGNFPQADSVRWDMVTEPLAPRAVEMSEAMNNESCNTWTEVGVLSPTVSAIRLAVPGKASGEYQKGCGAFRDKRYPEAEAHLHKALEEYPTYVAAWVVLGQVLDAQDKRDDAREACARASNIDPTYVPPYLCLADLAATENDWQEVSTMSDHALALDPNRNPYALYYKADADVHVEKFSDAEKHALAAVRVDKAHHLPQLHTLLAQIYKALGNVPAQAAQLREYLKESPNAPDAAGAKSVLAHLDSKLANP